MEELNSQTLREMFKNIDEKLDVIHEQTLKTNGRVSSHDKEISSLKESRAYLTGAGAIILLIWGYILKAIK